ncbi:hypothetical protein AB1Y20_010792 [Prymnesium parvum]|uniref:PUM-HD domain-containing protein n=1 Tax=Prymnesium parvum TaxID=97485 RepID=A0AB34ISI4_PRYPA
MPKHAAAAKVATGTNRKIRRANAALPMSDNPEGLSEAPTNTLFGQPASANAATGQKRPRAAATTDHAPLKVKRKQRAAAPKADPAASLQVKASSLQSKKRDVPSGGSSAVTSTKLVRPHAEVVERSTKIWEKLRTDKTSDAERTQLVDEVLQLFEGKEFEVLQKHDAARVMQSCFKQGESSQRDALMRGLKGQLFKLALSHYGHFLLLSIVRHGSAAHKQQLMTELKGHVAELFVHAEGSAVLQLMYTDVASTSQKHAMYRELWGIEFGMLQSASAQGEAKTLKALFESEPLAKPRVFKRMEILLSKAARKGLSSTALHQRAMAELIEYGDHDQRTELVSVARDSAVHIMHTRDGARVACGCVRHGDAKDRKAVLKAMKDHVSDAAQDPYGVLVLCTALAAVDDTVLLNKALLAELRPKLLEIATHAHAKLTLLQVLAPFSTRYFTAEQLAVIGEVDPRVSKKAPEQRRLELLVHLLPPLCDLCSANAVALACSPHGGAVFFETANAACDGATNAAEGRTRMLDALASKATEMVSAYGEDDSGRTPLLTHPIAARLFKRLAQKHPEFALGLLSRMRSKLLDWVKQGAAWVVLALLESPATAAKVRKHLLPSVAEIEASSAQGCRSLLASLKGLK